jgi:hypothetical protein
VALAFSERLKMIPWADFETAYGLAVSVPDQLRRLADADERTALAASHGLWCGLCHQHAYVSSAALPALPFILEILDRAGEQLTIEILDILMGFTVCTSPRAPCTGPGFDRSHLGWVAQLRAGVAAERPRLEQLAAHSNAEIAHLARKVLNELETPQ